VVEALLDLPPLHAEDRPVQVHILASRKLLVETGPDLEQASDASADLCASLGRERDPRENLEKSGLPRTVAADDAQDLSLRHLEGHVAERPDLRGRTLVLLAGHSSPGVDDGLPQRAVGGLVLTEAVLLRQRVDCDSDRHQIVSAKVGSDDRKVASPMLNS